MTIEPPAEVNLIAFFTHTHTHTHAPHARQRKYSVNRQPAVVAFVYLDDVPEHLLQPAGVHINVSDAHTE
jgi:hypothetical protein